MDLYEEEGEGAADVATMTVHWAADGAPPLWRADPGGKGKERAWAEGATVCHYEAGLDAGGDDEARSVQADSAGAGQSSAGGSRAADEQSGKGSRRWEDPGGKGKERASAEGATVCHYEAGLDAGGDDEARSVQADSVGAGQSSAGGSRAAEEQSGKGSHHQKRKQCNEPSLAALRAASEAGFETQTLAQGRKNMCRRRSKNLDSA